MTRRAVGVVALTVGSVLLVLSALAFALFARLLVLPTDAAPPGERGLAFVTALFLAALGVYLFAGGRRAWRGEAPVEEAPSRRRPPLGPVEVPPEEVELAEGPLTACLRCGNVGIRPLTLDAGLAFGSETLAWVCPRCHWRGQALAFDSPTSYRAFVRGLHEEARASAARDDEDDSAREEDVPGRAG